MIISAQVANQATTTKETSMGRYTVVLAIDTDETPEQIEQRAREAFAGAIVESGWTPDRDTVFNNAGGDIIEVLP